MFSKVILVCVAGWFVGTSSIDLNACPRRFVAKRVFRQNKHNDIFYVDIVNGNNLWNGKTPEPYPDKNTGPFQTIAGAIQRIRNHRKNLRKNRKKVKTVTLYVRAGTYFMSRIKLTHRDSNMKILAYPKDPRPIISAGIKIHWKDFIQEEEDPRIWSAPFYGHCSKHVFLGNKRLFRARKPNLESWNGNELSGKGPYLYIKDLLVSTKKCNRKGKGGFKQVCPDENKHGFVFHEGDINPAWASPEGGSTADILVFHAWTAERGRISHIIDNKVYFQSPLRKAVGTSPKPSGWRYIVENVREELDTAGEFFCEEKEGKSTLYFIPSNDSTKKRFLEDVYVAQNPTIFFAFRVSNLAFHDLDFRHSHDKNFEGYNPKPALLDFKECTSVRIHRCSFVNVGSTAVYFEHSVNCVVSESKFIDSGNIAICTKHSKFRTDEFATRDILIDKNFIQRCGATRMYQPSCIFLQGIKNIIVTRNDVSVTPYAGIMAGWQPTLPQNIAFEMLSKKQYVFKIFRNNIREYGQGILNDFGGIYLSSNSRCGQSGDLKNCHLPSLISSNTIHNSKGYWYGGIGVYGDTGLSSLSVKDNWIYDLADCAINFHCGQYNEAVNNMIYHTNRQRVFGTCKSIGSGSIPKQILDIKRNVIYVVDSSAKMYGRSDYWINEIPNVDQNVYYFRHGEQQKAFFPKGLSWDEWRSHTNNDKTSVIADPSYWKIKTKDFRLLPQSIALTMRIKSLDLRRVKNARGPC